MRRQAHGRRSRRKAEGVVYSSEATRGKCVVVLAGIRKALAIAVKNGEPRDRYTRLAECLRETARD